MATETFVIKIQQVGAATAAASIASIGTAAKTTAAAVQHTANIMGFFRKALVAFASLRIAGHMMEFADSATLINNRLRVATKSAEDFARAQKFIFSVSKETRTEVQASAVVYSRLLQATSEMKLSTEDLEQVMTNLNKSIAVGGATSQEAKNALIQFSQALASGALRGDELRSVSEQLPALANAIGKEFGLAKGQLLAFAKANPGILTVDRVIKGVLDSTQDMDEQFARTVPTMVNGWTAISNAAKKLIMEVQDGTGVFRLFYEALIIVADNLKAVVIAATLLVGVKLYSALAAWAAAFVLTHGPMLRTIALTYALVGAQGALNIAVRANPYVAAAIALVAFVALLVTLYQTVPVVTEAFNSLWEGIKNLGSFLLGVFAPAWNVIKLAMNAITPAMQAIGQGIAAMLEGWFLIIKTFNDVLMVVTPLGMALKAIGPILTAIGYIIMGVLLAAFTALIGGMRVVVEALNMFGVVSTETVAKVRESSDAWFQYIQNIGAGGLSFANTTEQQRQLGVSTEKVGTASTTAAGGVEVFNDGMDEMGRAKDNVSILDKLGVVLNTVAPAAERTGDSLTKTSDATITLENGSGQAAEAMKKLNPELFKGEQSGNASKTGFNAAAQGANTLTKSINALAAAYRALNAAKGGSSTITGGMNGARADGGPVRRGGTYLVGEEGPEMFTPGVSGYITSNDNAVTAMTTNAANDNANVTVGIGSNAARSMAASAASVADSVEVVATSVKKWVMTDYKNSSYANSVKYQFSDTAVQDRIDAVGQMIHYNTGVSVGQSYSRKDGSVPLPGDPDYVSKWGFKSWVGGINGPVVSAIHDQNDPTGGIRADAAIVGALGNEGTAQAMYASADKILQTLKDVRDNTAAFKQFQADQKALMGTDRYDGVGDFQTLLPMLGLGGTSMGEHDPYGLMKWKEPAQPQYGQSVSDTAGDSGENKKEIKIQMNVMTPNAESFRQNRATIEAGVAGMVKRAVKRAGG